MTVILNAIIVSLILAALLGFLLGFFKKIFFVPVDEKVAKVRECLPGANCGACGFPGCDGFAAALAAGEAPANGCAAGGPSVAEALGKALGVAVSAQAQVAVLACRGTHEAAQNKGIYNGVHTCVAAKISVNGTKQCPYGCIGFGDCVNVCKFGALTLDHNGLPKVNYLLCTGCGACAKACPQMLLAIGATSRQGSVALCSNKTTNKTSVLKQCKAGCIKCAKCEKGCPSGAIVLKNGIPVTDYSKCTSCGTCIAGCPTKALSLVQDVTATASAEKASA